MKIPTAEFVAPRDDNTRLQNLCGPLDENLRQIEQALDVTIQRRGHRMTVRGDRAQDAALALERFYNNARVALSIDDVQLGLVEARQIAAHGAYLPHNDDDAAPGVEDESPVLHTRRAGLQGRTAMQRDYLRNILSHDLTLGIGPAGTGKTYLAVACAVDALERDTVKRIVLTRPAVEAGERLGFLPGDLAQKVDPYLRPLYDALYDLLGFDRTQKMFERQMIEIAPLAYMRGRTLNHAFIILDEAQNTTRSQMMMFLTRLGHGSKMVVTGDTSQTDLDDPRDSGLVDAVYRLRYTRGIAFATLDKADIVRHSLVQRIVEAYDKTDKKRKRPDKMADFDENVDSDR